MKGKFLKKVEKFGWKKIILIILVLGLIWFVRPWFHGIFMFLYTNPLIIEGGIILLILRYYVHKKSVLPPQTFNWIFGLIFLVFISFVPLFTSVISQVHIVNEMDYNKITTLPENQEDIRLMPYEVAQRYTRDSLQLSQYKLGTGNIAIINDSLSWMFPLVPDGGILQFILKNKGISYVDATVQEKNSKMVSDSLEIGEGMQITDNLWWNLYKEKYDVNLDYAYYIPYEGELYTVVPAISYSFHQSYGLVYTVPRFEGIFLIDSSGDIQFLEPKEAKETPVLKDNRIYPEKLARFYTESYKYKNGILNRLFFHENQIDIQDINTRNKQPFLMGTKQGLKWFISTEPYGESRGIFKIFLIDAVSGKIDMYELPADKTLTGPIKATDFVRRSNPKVDWSRFKMVEPLPFIKGDTLYWKIVVIPHDAAGIAYQTFVNTQTNDVIEAENISDIDKFIKGEEIPEKEEKIKPDLVEQIQSKIKELQDLIKRLNQTQNK